MAKIKFTKGELKRQRDSLKQFKRYLPTLQLKKQQLQTKILEVRKVLEQRLSVCYEKENEINRWVGLLGEELPFDLKEAITPLKVITDTVNIAGADVPVFKDVKFKDVEINYYETPLWVDKGIVELRELIKAVAETEVIKRQIKILEKELITTTQRVNLFEKIKIPECQENIRKIRIYLGDQQANAVGVSKVAKRKVEERNLAEV